MRVLISPLTLALLVGTVAANAAKFLLPDKWDGAIANRYVPNQYIVELANGQTLADRTIKASPHAHFYDTLEERGISFVVKSEYNEPDIIVGAAITVKSPEDVKTVASLPGVLDIRPVMRIPRPKPVNSFIVNNASQIFADSYSTHIMTGVDKVHEEGNFGQGIRIGIIDSGVDYTHPALGGGFGPNCKIRGGYDLVGDSYNGENTPIPDPDPLDQCEGHGTHVAGIIGADPDNEFNIRGVAYRSSIFSYRVFGCVGSVQDDVIIQALLRAYEDKVHIITMSLGGPDGWESGMASVVASRIASKGKVVTVAAGNDGKWGSWYTSSPGNGNSVISVASIENTGLPVQNLTVHGATHTPIPYLQAFPVPFDGEYRIYTTSNDTSKVDDACSPLPSSTPDLSTYVVLIHRGSCSFVRKLSNAAAKGGKRFLIYNTDTQPLGAIQVGDYKAVLIQAEDGKYLVNEAAKNPNLTVSFPQKGAAFSLPNPNGGLIDEFSSIGPTFDMHFKPALAAPGGNILSTFPLKLGTYAVESGTSMATPFVAGAAALILSAKGVTPDIARSVRDRLQMTAVGVPTSNAGEDVMPHIISQQAAGLIQVHRAIHTQTFVGPVQITLNDTSHSRSKQTISITNNGSEAVTYSLRHVPAFTALTFPKARKFETDAPVPLSNVTSEVKLSTTKITVAPGETAWVPVTIRVPNEDPDRVPVYGGYIEVTGPQGPVKATYLGVAAALKDRKVLDDTDEAFGVPLPTLLTGEGLAMGTALFRVDLVDKDIDITPTIWPTHTPSKKGWLVWDSRKVVIGTDNNSFDDVKIAGTIGELKYLARNTDGDAQENGWYVLNIGRTFANDTAIPVGQWRILVRALKISGNPRSEGDYESWLSPIVGVIPPS